MADPKKLDIDNFTIPAPVAKRETLNIDEMSSGQTPDRKMLDNAPATDDWLTSTAKAVPTTIIKGLSHVPGMFGEIMEGGTYLGQRAAGFFSGRTPEQQNARRADYYKRFSDESPLLAKAASLTSPERWLPTGRDIAAPILKRTGEYEPTSTAGRYAMDAAEAGISMIAPGGGIKAGVTKRAPGVGSAAPKLTGFATDKSVDLAKTVLKEGAKPKMIALGAAGGAGASAATDLTGDPLVGMAAAPIATGAADIAMRAAHARAPGWTKAGTKDRAGTEFIKNVDNRDAVLNAPEANPLGTKMTTAEASGDLHLARAEAALEGTDQQFAARMHGQRAENAATRQQHMQTFADPNANPMALADAYVRQLDELHAEQAAIAARRLADAEATRTGAKGISDKVHQTTQELHDAAVGDATKRVADAPQPNAVDRSTTGDRARDIAGEGDSNVGAQVTRLYDAVNPERNLNVVTTGSAGGARQMIADFNPAVQKKSPGHEYVEMVAALPDVLPFHDLVKLDQTITAGMADFKNTNRGAHGQLTALKDMVQQDLRNALENQIAWEQRAVANGMMAADETIGARLAAEARAYQDNARTSARTGTGNDASVGAPGVSSATGEVGGPGVLAGTGPVPNFTPEDLARYTAAKQRHIDRVEGWRSGPVGDALKTSGFSGDYKMPGSKVAATIFKKGDGGGENLNAWLRGADGDPQMLQIVQDLASTSLHEAATKAGGLTPDVLAKWRQEHGPALRRLDEEVSGFSDRFNDTATARQALEDVEAARKQALKASASEREKQHRGADKAYETETKAATAEKDAAIEAGRQQGQQFTGRDSTEDMRRGVGRVLSSDNSATQIGKILEDVGHDPAAVAGLRKAAADWMVDNFSSTMTESKSRGVQPKMSKFISGREETLRRLYGDDGFQNIKLLADDIDRGAAHVAARSSPGSPTSSNMAKFLQGLSDTANHNVTFGVLAGTFGYNALMTMSWGSILGTAAIFADKMVGGAMRAKSASKVHEMLSDAMADPKKGKLLLQHAIDAEGRPNMSVIMPLLAPIRAEQPDDDRAKERFKPGNWPASGEGLTTDMKRRAAGGRIGAIDHAAEAAHYVRLAARAKTLHGKKTESFLKVPDATVAKALAVAHEAI